MENLTIKLNGKNIGKLSAFKKSTADIIVNGKIMKTFHRLGMC